MRKGLFVAMLLACSLAKAESVPLVRDHGTFLVPVLLNNSITLKFTIDSGAADVSLPEDVVSTLVRTGSIAKTDFLDSQMYQLADGSMQMARRLRIRSLRLGTFELHDVTASVAPTAGGLLLGQTFLTKLNSWTIDNQRGLLLFNEAGKKRDGSSPLPEPEPQETKWTFVIKDTAGNAFYANVFDAHITAGKRTGWFKVEYASRDHHPFANDSRWHASSIYQVEIDCSQQTYLTRVDYPYLNDGTEFTQAVDSRMPPGQIKNGSVSEAEMKYLCGS
jgi:hypothetical protein